MFLFLQVVFFLVAIQNMVLKGSLFRPSVFMNPLNSFAVSLTLSTGCDITRTGGTRLLIDDDGLQRW